MSRITWFEKLFGYEEYGARSEHPSTEDYERNKSSFHAERDSQDDGNIYLVSRSNGRKFCVGSFDCLSLQQLRRIILTPNVSEANPPNAEPSTSYVHIAVEDILAMHFENPGATFQTASQFNCLEFSSPNVVPEHGVTSYMLDRTQGPACALACAASSVYRNYLTPVRDSTDAQSCAVGQTTDHQINNLSGLEKILKNKENRFWTVRNGYVFSDVTSLTRLNRELDERISAGGMDDITGSIRIGVQTNSEVTFTSRFQLPPDGQCVLVNQVFCSALSCSYSGVAVEHWEKFAKLVLDACYEASVLAAMLTNPPEDGSSRVLYLTFLGGGVFGNKPEWVISAIAKAVALAYRHELNLAIIICHYKRINTEWRNMIDSAVQREMNRGASHPEGERRQW